MGFLEFGCEIEFFLGSGRLISYLWQDRVLVIVIGQLLKFFCISCGIYCVNLESRVVFLVLLLLMK